MGTLNFTRKIALGEGFLTHDTETGTYTKIFLRPDRT